jgi:hypothetical protein
LADLQGLSQRIGGARRGQRRPRPAHGDGAAVTVQVLRSLAYARDALHLALCVGHQHEHVAAPAAKVRVSDAQARHGGNGGFNGVATASEHVHTGLGGQRVGAGHHAGAGLGAHAGTASVRWCV